jgi:hypothetical protein
VPFIAVTLGIFAWLVAEFVTRQRRMRLSSTVLGLGFMAAMLTVLGFHLEGRAEIQAVQTPVQIAALRPQATFYALVLFGGTALAAIVYFLRFRVPVMAAVLALSFTGAAFFFATLYFYDGVVAGQMLMPTLQQVPEILAKALYVPLICGLIVFGTAVASTCTTASGSRSGRTAPSGCMSSRRHCWCIRCSSWQPARTWCLAKSSRAFRPRSCWPC